MKVIAITQRLSKIEDYGEIRDSLDVQWAHLCRLLGFLPIVLPTYFNFRQYASVLKLGGFILTGGNDLGVLNPDDLSCQRDDVEKAIIRYAISKKIPLLGVCRGMQLIADYFGAPFKRIEGHVACQHPLKISPLTKYRSYLEKIKMVNSYHHFCPEHLPASLMVSAQSPEGSIEALEHQKYRIFGQMWHPERKGPYKTQQYRFIKDFFNQKGTS